MSKHLALLFVSYSPDAHGTYTLFRAQQGRVDEAMAQLQLTNELSPAVIKGEGEGGLFQCPN